jgi:hypothetical protein
VNRDGTLRRHTVPTKDANAVRADFCNGSGIKPVAERNPQAVRAWVPATDFDVKSSSRTYTVRLGDRCRVAGLGRGGAVGSGWTVTAIERHAETGKVNVTVLHANDRSRIVESGRIVYRRQTGAR